LKTTVKDIEDDSIKDPFLEYGVGIVAYFRIQSALMKLYILLAFLSIPTTIFFAKYNGTEA